MADEAEPRADEAASVERDSIGRRLGPARGRCRMVLSSAGRERVNKWRGGKERGIEILR